MKNQLFLFQLLLPLSLSAQTLSNPIPEKITFSDLVVELETFATMPVGGPGPVHTTHSDNRARINMIREVPGSDKLAVIDLNGYLYLLDTNGNLNLYLKFKDHFNKFIDASGKGTGSGAMAFHPEFATNGIFYTAHAESKNAATPDFVQREGNNWGQWVLTRWTVSNPLATTFSGTKQELVRLNFSSSIHGMQDITFNPFARPGDEDYGLLYICNGDGASGESGWNDNVGNVYSHLSSIWRIDPEGSNSANGKYGVPTTNPFFNTPDAVREIWAYGFRNPHRLSFEIQGDDTLLFVGDIGQHNIEELNLIEKGGNYGWNHREGTFLFNKSTKNVEPLPTPDNEDFIYPVAQYDHDEGAAIALGYTWTADNYPLLKGQMFFSDILYGDLFHVPLDSLIQGRQYPIKEAKISIDGGNPTTFKNLFFSEEGRIDLRFFRNSAGEIMMFTKMNGNIYKVKIPGEASNTRPVAAFTLDKTSGNAPLTVNVNGDLSSDADEDDLTYSWDFGNGNTSEGITSQFTYQSGGEYEIKLVVNDGKLNSTTTTKVVNVNTVPVAAFSMTHDTTEVFKNVGFDANASSDADQNALTYSWEFGDGNTKSGKTSTNQYSEPGDYVVILTVNDGKGGVDQTSKTITILSPSTTVTFVENGKKPIVLYPNPVDNILTIESEVTLNIEVLSISGASMFNQKLPVGLQKIDLSSFPSGEYVIHLKTAEKEYKQTIIKK